MALSFDDSSLLKLFFLTTVLSLFYQSLGAEHEVEDEHLLCRHCGHEVVKAEHLITTPSRVAIGQRNDTILGQKGVLIQRFVNPQGMKFEVITTKDTEITKTGGAFPEYTFFPGFTWTVCVCPRCHTHLGWHFRPISDALDKAASFYGLILDKLLHKGYADSLLVIPKSFRS